MASNGIIEVTDASFEQEVLKNEAPVLIDFWAPWCGPCKAIAPIVDELASAFSGRVKVTKMNIDQNAARELAAMGYTNIRDYAEGKQDWLDAKLPIESFHKH